MYYVHACYARIEQFLHMQCKYMIMNCKFRGKKINKIKARNPMISYGSFISNFQQNLHAAIANIPTFTKRAGGG